LRSMEEHQAANHSYFADGVRLLELARRAGELFRGQPASSKRRLLDFLLSNSVWMGGELRATFRQPFDLIAVTADADRVETAAGGGSGDRFDNWVPERDSKNRPICEQCTAVTSISRPGLRFLVAVNGAAFAVRKLWPCAPVRF